MTRNYTSRLTFALVYCTALFLSGCGAVGDFVNKIQEAIDEVHSLRKTVENEGQAWRVQIDKTQLKLTQDVKGILNEDLRQFTDKTIGSVGAELRCNVDFIQAKITNYLKDVEDDLSNLRDRVRKEGVPQGVKPEDLISKTIRSRGHIPPYVCQSIPAEVVFNHVNSHGQPDAFAAAQTSITFTGFNLNNPDLKEFREKYAIVLERQTSESDGPLEAVSLGLAENFLAFTTPYQIVLNLSSVAPLVQRGDRKIALQFNGKTVSEVQVNHGPPPQPIVVKPPPVTETDPRLSEGSGGAFTDPRDFDDSPPDLAKIGRIIVKTNGNEVNGIKIVYKLNGQELPDAAQMHGGAKGDERSFVIDDDDYLIGITGRSGNNLDFIRFHTRKGRSEGFGGGGGDHPFSFFCEDKNGMIFEVIGFHGRTRDVIITQIGLKVRSR